MKYFLFLLLLVSGVSMAQTPTLQQPTATGGWVNPNPGSYGTVQQGLIVWKVLGFPTGNGVPTGSQKVDLKVAYLYMDSTSGTVYARNPKTGVWGSIGSGGGGGSQTWEQTLTQQGATPFTTDNTVNFGGHSLTLNNFSSLNESISNVSADSTVNISASLRGFSVNSYLPTGQATLSLKENQIVLQSNDIDGYNSSINVLNNIIKIKTSTATDSIVKLQLNVDSSDANQNNIAWFDENNILHRGHITTGGSDSTILQPLTVDASMNSNGPYNGSAPVTHGVRRAWLDSIIALGSPSTGNNSTNFYYDTISANPNAADGKIVRVAHAGTSGAFIGHEDQVASPIPATTNYNYSGLIPNNSTGIQRNYSIFSKYDSLGHLWNIVAKGVIWGGNSFVGDGVIGKTDTGGVKIVSNNLILLYLRGKDSSINTPFLTGDTASYVNIINGKWGIYHFNKDSSFDSLRNNAGVLEARRHYDKVWVSQNITLGGASATALANFYLKDSTLSSNRTVTGGGNSLTFTGLSDYTINSTNALTIAKTVYASTPSTGFARLGFNTSNNLYYINELGYKRIFKVPFLGDDSIRYPNLAAAVLEDSNHASATYLTKANNLSDLASASTARTNLGLGSFATLNNPATTDGDLLYYKTSAYQRLPTGTTKQSLHPDGSGGYTWKDTTAVGAGGITGAGAANRLPNWSSSSALSYVDSIFIDNSSIALPKIGIGTSTPVGALTIDSARFMQSTVGKGFYGYHTLGQTTNYSRFHIYGSGTNTTLTNEVSGTPTKGIIYFNGSNAYIDANGGLGTTSVLSTGGISGTTISGTAITASTKVNAFLYDVGNNTTGRFLNFWNSISGNSIAYGFGGKSQQTGTAGNRNFVIGMWNSSYGSGINSILEVGTNTAIDLTGTQTNGLKMGTDYVTTFYRPLASLGSTPSNTLGTGAGTGATATITGNDAAGYVSITTGTTPTAGGNIITVTFSTALTNTPKTIMLTQGNQNAAIDWGKVYADQSTASTTSFIIKNISTVALQASTTYIFYYNVTQ